VTLKLALRFGSKADIPQIVGMSETQCQRVTYYLFDHAIAASHGADSNLK
jgi:hypothetical protein